MWRYYLIGWLLPLLAVAAILLMAQALGVSQPDYSLKRSLALLAPNAKSPTGLSPLGVLSLLSVQSLVAGAIVAPLLWGEEFGWRSYLQLRILPHRPLGAAVVTGAIWALWHFPLGLMGYHFPDNRVLGLLVFSVTCVLLSIVFGWIRLRSGSIWPVCLAHSATNSVGASMTMLLFFGDRNWLLTSYVGILAWIPLGAVAAWIVVTGRLKDTRHVISAPEDEQTLRGDA
jgi:membrane protease YdiL (CAAX protease family)